ncbi:MAG TPA: DUF4276 family protein [Thermoanaerobaculia bacterium]|jgi:hypothetical protein
MKIGVLVEGQAEFRGLPLLLPRLGSPHQVMSPLVCNIHPFASPAQIALAASKRFPILLAKGAESIVILFDKETRQDCTVDLVRAVEHEARTRLQEFSSTIEIQVVLKVSMFENWLVSDPQAVGDVAGLFENAERIEKKVKGRADAVDALGLLKACSRQRIYDKVEGAVAICRRLDPVRAAENSRSFRKLLKVLEVPQESPRPRRSSHSAKR